jgi:tRNA(Leu) C34 or U34 (ribose-2'-O)-methylase TrmL
MVGGGWCETHCNFGALDLEFLWSLEFGCWSFFPCTSSSSNQFAPDDYLVFGRETAGLPSQLLAERPEQWLRIPMFNPQSRSLNLANCVALVLFEALRQQGFAGEI